MMNCECLTTAGDGCDNMVLKICGHRPDCPEFRIDSKVFCANVRLEAQLIADQMALREDSPTERQLVKAKQLLNEMLNYLDTSDTTYIAATSIFHNQIRQFIRGENV